MGTKRTSSPSGVRLNLDRRYQRSDAGVSVVLKEISFSSHACGVGVCSQQRQGRRAPPSSVDEKRIDNAQGPSEPRAAPFD